jgi:hypothetical protein
MELAKTLDVWEREIQLAKSKSVVSLLTIGRALSAISEGSLWMPTGCKSFDQYCEQAHGFKRSWAYNLIGVWGKFGPLMIADASLMGTDITRLSRLLPLATEENREELLHSAAQIPDSQGFDNLIRNLQGKIGTDECQSHDFQPIDYEQCKICGQRRKVVREVL